MNSYKPGRSYWNGLIRRFLATDKDRFMAAMKLEHSYRNPNGLSEAKIQSWDECYDSMQQALWNLAATAPQFKKLGIVFEYSLPLHNNPEREGLRYLDCAIVGSGVVAVLEFKMWTKSFVRRRPEKLEFAAGEVCNYATKLETMHVESFDRSVYPVVVLCRETNHMVDLANSSMDEPVRVISTEALPDTLIGWFGRRPHLDSLSRWHNSEWVERD